jgi:murein DD-endopeptidase / murein LD-carboxypeptidase
MIDMKKNRLGKSIVGISLSLSLFATGSMMLNPQSAQAATVSASSTASNIIKTGEQFMGVRYQFGARTGNTSSFDCSSFTQYVYRLNGVNIPRSSKQQSQAGTYVSRDQLQPGDLVFFYSPIHHVAIYMGNGKLLHTFGSPGVTITDLNSGWWSSHYATARRVLPNGQTFNPSVPQPQQQAAPVGNQPKQTFTPTKHSNNKVQVYHRPTSSSNGENQQEQN